MSEKFFNNRTAFIVLLTACFIVFVSMGVRQTFGLFFDYFKEDLNISRTQAGLAIAIQAIVWGLMSFFIGIFADRFGARYASFIALMVYALGIFLIPFSSESGIPFQIYLGIFTGIGLAGAAAPMLVPTVSKHFPNHNRAKASGLVTASASTGMFLFPLIAVYFLKITLWSKVLLIFVAFLVIAAIISLFLKKPDASNQSTQTLDSNNQSLRDALREAFAHRGYILLVSGFFVCGFQITLVATHVPSYVMERGLEAWTGGAILSLIGLFNIFGTLTMGYLADKYSKRILLSGLYFLRGITIIIFLLLPASTYSALFFGISFGFLWLATIPATSGIVAQIFGTKHLSMLFGIVFFSHQVGAFFGAYLGGYFFDNLGTYDYAWYMSIALSIFATIIHLPIDEKPLIRNLSS